MDDTFALFPLSRQSRLAAAAGMFAAGAMVQTIPSWGLAAGSTVIILGWLPLALRRLSTKPADTGLEEWRPVSMAEVDRLADALRLSKKTKARLAGGSLGSVALSIFLLVLAVLGMAGGRGWGLLALDSFLFSFPALFFGRPAIFVPKALDLKMPCFQAVFEAKARDNLVLTPYFRFDKDKEGRDIPEDMRLMLEPKHKPLDFVGVQLQAAVNKGPNGEVPYLYAVFLTKGKGPSYSRLSSLRLPGYVVEAGGDGEYGSLVLRQQTSGGGYATKPADCERLYQAVGRGLALLEP
ncbi:MAG TPA: hypothetical protein VIO60_11535 [Rectinemataceae bacterium]